MVASHSIAGAGRPTSGTGRGRNSQPPDLTHRRVEACLALFVARPRRAFLVILRRPEADEGSRLLCTDAMSCQRAGGSHRPQHECHSFARSCGYQPADALYIPPSQASGVEPWRGGGRGKSRLDCTPVEAPGRGRAGVSNPTLLTLARSRVACHIPLCDLPRWTYLSSRAMGSCRGRTQHNYMEKRRFSQTVSIWP
jgi:hypothetical protein